MYKYIYMNIYTYIHTYIHIQVDATANDLPKSLGVRGFPTLLLFKGDGSAPINYDGERDFAALSKFVTSKTGAKVRIYLYIYIYIYIYPCMCVCVLITMMERRTLPPFLSFVGSKTGAKVIDCVCI